MAVIFENDGMIEHTHTGPHSNKTIEKQNKCKGCVLVRFSTVECFVLLLLLHMPRRNKYIFPLKKEIMYSVVIFSGVFFFVLF